MILLIFFDIHNFLNLRIHSLKILDMDLIIKMDHLILISDFNHYLQLQNNHINYCCEQI